MVEAAFRPADEKPRSLLDFIDEQSVETMRDALKESIRESKEAQTTFDSSLLSFDNDLRSLKTSMTGSTKSSPSQSYNTLESPIPTHLRSLETHAQEMASLLDSLVSHFDLCVNAIKHTEGGYAAVRKAASNPPPGAEPVSVSGVMKAGDEEKEEALSEEERREMLQVLETDAAEVEDVVMELRDRLNDMEVKNESILSHISFINNAYNETTNAYQLLEGVGQRLQGYINASQDFALRWSDTKLLIHYEVSELENIRLFYENYYSSYDSLILEVARRKASEEKVKGILRKAMEQVKKVDELDRREREGFRHDIGDYLPADLWPGLVADTPKWDVSVLEGSGEGANGSAPELEKGLVEAAAKRERERQMGG
jgi:autophagy-related protein 17